MSIKAKMYECMQVNSMTGSRQSKPEVVDSGPETVKNEAFSNL